MNDSHPDTDSAAGSLPATDWLTLADAAERLDRPISTVRQMLREGELLAVRVDGRAQVPAAFIEDGQTSRYFRGIVTSLRDGGFTDDEAMRWLLTYDDSLGGTPAWAMHHQLHREVSRRAQALAF